MNSQQKPANTSSDDQNLSLPAPQSAAPQPQPVAQPQASAQTTAQPAAQPAATPMATADDSEPLIADDTDLIEKEWVEKAKQLVDKTKDDPYNQNKEINKFKATYIKKRYNKDVQLSNE